MKLNLGYLLVFLPAFTMAQQASSDNINLQGKTRYNDTELNAYSYTLGFKVLSVEQFAGILDQANHSTLRTSVANGFILKYNDKQISYRLTGSFYSGDLSFVNGTGNAESISGRLADNQVKLGFEKNFTYTRIQPYFGIDLGFKQSIFKGQTSGSGANDYRVSKNGATASPVLGVKLNLVDHFTVAAETTLDLFYYYDKQEINTGTANATLNKYYKWDYLLKPLGQLSIQYNFGRNY